MYVETESLHEQGSSVLLDGSEIIRAEVGLAGTWRCIRNLGNLAANDDKGKEAACDARLMGIRLQDQKREERTWRDVTGELKEEKFDDWRVPGPRTSMWCSRFLNRRNGGCVDHHGWWVSTHQLKLESWGVAEHESMLKIVDKLGRYDGLDLSNIARAELAFRRLQPIEYFYSERGPGSSKGSGKAKAEKNQADETLYRMESSIFSGTHCEFGDTMVCPDLMDFVGKEVEREARRHQVSPTPPETRASLGGSSCPSAGNSFRVFSMSKPRQRGIFPLPFPSSSSSHCSRSVARRELAESHVGFKQTRYQTTTSPT